MDRVIPGIAYEDPNNDGRMDVRTPLELTGKPGDWLQFALYVSFPFLGTCFDLVLIFKQGV
jgi:hypothetical protein